LKEYQRTRDLLRKLVKAHPDVSEYQSNLAHTHNHRGLLLVELGKRAEALKEYQQARDLLRKLVKAQPQLLKYLEGLARACLNCGALLAQMNRLPASRVDFDEAIQRIDELRRLAPRNRTVPAFLLFGLSRRAYVLNRLGKQSEADADWDRVLKLAPPAQRPALRLARASSRAIAGDYRRAAAEAEELGRSPALGGATLYNLAWVQALNAAGARRDPLRPLPEREKNAEVWARQAVELLRRADRAGFFKAAKNVAHLDRDRDLAFLRDRDDYRRFRAALRPPG
jgi:tetratricopeptide (TPR) repeat protein